MSELEALRVLEAERTRAQRRFLYFFGPLLLLGVVCPSYELLTLNQHLLLAKMMTKS